MVWKIGPACVAQQAKKVAASTMKGVGGVAGPTAIGGSAAASAPPALAALFGARRTASAAGIRSTQAAMPIASCADRQSVFASSQAANGETVMGATPTPAETSETARLRRSGSQALTAVIIGTKKLPADRPTTRP